MVSTTQKTVALRPLAAADSLARFLFPLSLGATALGPLEAERQANPPASEGFAESATVLGGFQNQRRDGLGPAIFVYGHESDGSGSGVLALAGQHVFRKHLHAHFHRRAEGAVDVRAEDDQLPDADRVAKIHVVHRGRDHMTAAMAVGGDGRGD